jgi:hypothetical protein
MEIRIQKVSTTAGKNTAVKEWLTGLFGERIRIATT